MAWTDEKREQVIEMYTKAEPTPETSTEIVKDIADEIGESVNGTRMILQRAGVYVKKEGPAGGAKAPSSGGGGKRVSKESAQQDLRDAIVDAGQEVDEDLISKLTGKAAVYFTTVITSINSN